MILSTRIPLGEVRDKVAWVRTTNGQYSVKTGYHHCHVRNIDMSEIIRRKAGGKFGDCLSLTKEKSFCGVFVETTSLFVRD